MYVIPLKWMPFVLIIVGVVGLVSDEVFGPDKTAPIVMLAIGSLWLWLANASNDKKSSENSSNTSSTSNPSNVPSSTSASKDTAATQTVTCSCCGAEINKNSIFCGFCGTRR